MATDKNQHLACVIESHRTSKEQKLLDKHIEKRDKVKAALEEKYGNKLFTLFNSGSYAKNTAINKKFDFDMMAPFKRDAFSTLKEMYEEVYNFLNEKYSSEAIVRKQRVSTGIEFFSDTDGHVVKIDVVPGRELKQDQYKEDNKLNLFVYKQFGKLEPGSERIQSNVRAQIDNVRYRATNEKDSIRKIVRLLKVWRLYNQKTPKSFFLELITIKAFDNKTVSGTLWDKLKIVMEYISDNVNTVSLPDPGNSSNDVADTLTDNDKNILSDDMKYMIERIEEDSDTIKSYYPINFNHPCEEDKDKKNEYTQRQDKPSIPPPTRFG